MLTCTTKREVVGRWGKVRRKMTAEERYFSRGSRAGASKGTGRDKSKLRRLIGRNCERVGGQTVRIPRWLSDQPTDTDHTHQASRKKGKNSSDCASKRGPSSRTEKKEFQTNTLTVRYHNLRQFDSRRSEDRKRPEQLQKFEIKFRPAWHHDLNLNPIL